MKNSIRMAVSLLFLSCIFQCSPKNHETGEASEELIEANQIHQQSLDLREEIMDLEKDLKASDIDYSDLKESLKVWDKDIIEVPGFGHSHDDAHQRNYHVHNAPKQLGDQEHLDYQKMMHEEIVSLHEQFKLKLVPKVMDNP